MVTGCAIDVASKVESSFRALRRSKYRSHECPLYCDTVEKVGSGVVWWGVFVLGQRPSAGRWSEFCQFAEVLDRCSHVEFILCAVWSF